MVSPCIQNTGTLAEKILRTFYSWLTAIHFELPLNVNMLRILGQKQIFWCLSYMTPVGRWKVVGGVKTTTNIILWEAVTILYPTDDAFLFLVNLGF